MPASRFGMTRFMSEGHASKLSEDKVMEIKRLLRGGVPSVVVARQFEVSRSMICKIKAGQRWAWVE